LAASSLVIEAGLTARRVHSPAEVAETCLGVDALLTKTTLPVIAGVAGVRRGRRCRGRRWRGGRAATWKVDTSRGRAALTRDPEARAASPTGIRCGRWCGWQRGRGGGGWFPAFGAQVFPRGGTHAREAGGYVRGPAFGAGACFWLTLACLARSARSSEANGTGT